MKATNRSKFITEIETVHSDLTARRPFKIEKEERRRFIRLEISSPMTVQKIKNTTGQFWPEGEWHRINGTILNISGGGVLLELDQTVHEGDIVVMNFTLQEVEPLSNVLGMVKRADSDDGMVLVGIEFMTRDALKDRLSKAELEMLSPEFAGFNESVHKVLNKYVFRQRLAGRQD